MDEESAAPRTEFVCFGRPVRDVIGSTVNSLTVTVAAVTLGFAVAALVDGTDVTNFVDQITVDYHLKDLWSIPISLILLSSIMILMPCFTLNHCVKGNKCTLVIYMSIIVVLLGLMIAAIIVDEQSRDLSYLRDAMNYSLTNYEPGFTEEWDEIQRNEACCGIEGAPDWSNLNDLYPDESVLSPPAFVPASCCSESHGVADQTDCMQYPIRYQTSLPGCLDVISDLVEFHSKRTIVAGSFAVVALVANMMIAIRNCMANPK